MTRLLVSLLLIVGTARATLTPPAVATPVCGSNTCTITWTNPAECDAPSSSCVVTTENLSWRVERCTGGGCTNFAEIATTTAGATQYVDNTVSNGNTYQWRLRADPYSNIVSGTPQVAVTTTTSSTTTTTTTTVTTTTTSSTTTTITTTTSSTTSSSTTSTTGSSTTSTTSTTIPAGGGTFRWSKRGGGTAWDQFTAATIDSSGNTYATGYFCGSGNWGGATLTPAGAPFCDVILVKYDSSGNHVWSKNIGGSLTDTGYALVTDALGAVYVTGYFYGTVDFSGGLGTGNLTSAGTSDGFLAKYSTTDGSFVWVKRIGGRFDDFGYDVTVDASNNVIVVGQWQDGMTLGGGGTGCGTSVGGGSRPFVVKYSSAGACVWADTFTASVSGWLATSVALADSGNLILAGTYSVPVLCGAGTLTHPGPTADPQMFLAKLASTGAVTWCNGSTATQGGPLAQDLEANTTDGTFLVTGSFIGTTNFGAQSPVSVGGKDIFVAKYDGTGANVWARGFGSTVDDSGFGVVEMAGDYVVTGLFNGATNFGAGSVNPPGAASGFVARYSSAGGLAWVKTFGPNIGMIAHAIAHDASFDTTTVGGFQGTVNFGGGNLISAGGDDTFAVSFGP